MTDGIDDEQLLSRFRQWLQETRAETERRDREGSEPLPNDDAVDVREIGLYQVIEEFTALRHELKLQTRSARSLQEQTDASLSALREAIDAFRSVQPKEAQAAWSAGKALAEALADLDVALDRGRAGVEKAARRLVEEPVRALRAGLDDLYARQSPLRRLLCRSYHRQVRELAQGEGLRARQEILDAMIEGYALIQSRLRRTLKAEQIHAIACVGRPVDLERMTVVEVVDDPSRPPGEVVEEIRRGYTWQGRLLRYAEVRASRLPPVGLDATDEELDSHI
jgi:molecular chaperone GrpE